jgi:DNA-binding NarL/FixJ family response regulator
MENTIKIGVVDDHNLYRSGIIKLIESLNPNYKIVLEAANGKDFFSILEKTPLIDIVLLDISMPIMNGYETAKVLQNKYPNIKVLVITMNDDEISLIKMLKLGVKGFVGKDIEPDVLDSAINTINNGGYHQTRQMTNHLIRSYQNDETQNILDSLTDKEIVFIILSCSEDSYKDIAIKMFVSPRTVDGYRDSTFTKVNVKSRVGLAIFAIKSKLVVIE